MDLHNIHMPGNLSLDREPQLEKSRETGIVDRWIMTPIDAAVEEELAMSEKNPPKELGTKGEKTLEKLSMLGPTLMIASFLAAWVLVPSGMSWLRVPLFLVFGVVSTLAMLKIQRRYLVVVNDVLEKLFTPFLVVLVLVFSMAPAFIVYSGSKWLTESAPRWSQAVVLVLSACFLLYSLHQIYAPGGTEKFFVRIHKQGVLAPLVIAANLLFVCVGLFSTFVLVLPGNDTFFVDNPHPDHGQIADFFLWHFFDMVPLFDFDETLKWKAPFEYEHAAVGWILVLFKLVVALPVIRLVAAYYSDRSNEASAEKPSAEPQPTS